MIPRFEPDVIGYAWRTGAASWTTLQDVTYTTLVTGRPVRIAIPAGTATDLASVPKALHWLIDNDGPWNDAALVHDVLYRHPPVWCTRARADAVLREAMRVRQVPRATAWAIYSGVRVGGWVAWRNYRRRD